MMGSNKTYSDMLDSIFPQGYDGAYKEILIYIPRFFNLLQEIYISKNLDWKLKLKINCCFSYFAMSNDVIPDDDPIAGYIDDLFICSYTLNELLKVNPQLVININGEGEEIRKRVNEILEKTSNLLKEDTNKILSMVGLLKFNDICENNIILTESVDNNIKLERIYYETQELISILKTAFISQGYTLHIRKLSDLKKLFTEEQWEKVTKILQELEIHESKYDTRHETMLNQIKREVLLDIDESLLEDVNG
ncbi:MAG: DUF1232 domain-containing protein [Proteobacteria bacterium]|nr:DUF1232 domain-containing protein [Pseudomonadota bacterium]